MKVSKRIKESKSYAIGYEEGKKETIDKLIKFVDNESKFMPDIHTDKLLDRLVNFIKKL